jgi:transposase InsO family protein
MFFVCRHGVPQKILTDRGKAFIREFMTAINQQLEVEPLRTSGFHPQTNGITERFNKTLLMFVHIKKNWDEYLPYVVHAY